MRYKKDKVLKMGNIVILKANEKKKEYIMLLSRLKCEKGYEFYNLICIDDDESLNGDRYKDDDLLQIKYDDEITYGRFCDWINSCTVNDWKVIKIYKNLKTYLRRKK